MAKTIKINAGKVQYDEETKRCTPLPFKGVITIKPNEDEEEFYDFVWTPKSNTTKSVEKDELLIIPGDVSFKQVSSCKTGRVFALTFLSSGAKNLYWLQDIGDDDQLDKLTEKDQSIVHSIEELITLKEEEEEETDIKTDEKKEPAQSQDQFKLPIHSISDLLTPQLIDNHLASLSKQELTEKYGSLLPPSINADNISREKIMEIVRSGFFQQSNDKLSEQLRNGTGAGFILSQSLKYDYKGEGVDGFLAGVRDLSKKSEDEDQK